MSEAELRWLAEVAQHMGSIVELGCWKGRSTCALAGACKGPVYAVDHWRGSADERATTHQEATRRDIIVDFRANTRHLANVVMVVGDVAGREVYSLFDDESTEPDMVFVDAGHTEAEVGQQIHVWWKRTGRVIVGHDFNWPGVRDAVMRYFGCDPSGVSVYQGAGSLWCALKPGVSPEQIGAHVIA